MTITNIGKRLLEAYKMERTEDLWNGYHPIVKETTMRIHFEQGDVIAAQHATGWTAFFEDKDILGEGETMMEAIADLNEKENDHD